VDVGAGCDERLGQSDVACLHGDVERGLTDATDGAVDVDTLAAEQGSQHRGLAHLAGKHQHRATGLHTDTTAKHNTVTAAAPSLPPSLPLHQYMRDVTTPSRLLDISVGDTEPSTVTHAMR
jgi:hypothetical protein